MTITALLNMKAEMDRLSRAGIQLAEERDLLRARLEVSEAVNRAKTELLMDVVALLSDDGCTPGQQVMNARTVIAVRTGQPKSAAEQRCAECACDDPPSQCDWIKPSS